MPERNNTEISDDDIVISGISGNFPETTSIDELKEKLFDNAEFIKICEYSNWGKANLTVPKFIGRMSGHNSFDSTFFGINKKICDDMNSMIRNMIERSYEAIVDAGLSLEDVRNTGMGVMMGSNISESESTRIRLGKHGHGYGILGHNRALIANRISYCFNVYGPSYAILSAETSGVETLTLAYEAIKNGHCETALVGAVSFVLHPEISYHYKGLGVLSEDGCNRSFDDNASGHVRSEASVALFLQKAKYAKRIYASIVHSEFDCYGDRKAGYIVPLEYPLTSLLSSFYQRCGIDPSLISYLEADGSGIKDLDTKELNALAKVLLCKRQTPLPIGSIKSNLGHTDAASALVSIVKVLIAMETGKIPPNNNYNKPSQQVPALVEEKFKVVTEPMPWSGGLAAVNSVGLNGVVGHVVLRSHKKEKVNDGLPTDEIPRLLVISGRTEEGLKETLTKLESKPVDVECLSLLHDIYSRNVPNYNYRGYTIFGKDNNHREIKHYENLKRPVWFVFSGMGSQWPGMGSKLLQFPIISESIQRSHNILMKKGLDLLNIINSTDKNIFDNILKSFVGIAAIQIALVDFLKLLDITPDGYVGHSVGELGCAYMDGCFTAEETLLAAYYRGLASNETELIPGYMAAIGLGYKDVKELCPPEIDVACHNSSNSSTISGPEEIVKTFVEQLKKENIFARAVNVANIAYHSRYIKPAAPKLLEYLKKLVTDPKPRSSRWISSSVPESNWETPLAKYSSAEYHTNNLLSPVLFEESTKCIPNNAIVIEIAPHGLLQAIMRRSFGSECIHIPLTLRGHPNSAEFLLVAVGKLYMAGILPKVSNLYPPVQYPVSRGTASLSSLVTWDHGDHLESPLDMDTSQLEGFDASVDHHFTISLNQERERMLEGHKLAGKVILPLSYLLQITWTYFCSKLRKNFTDTSVIFQDLHVHQHLEIPEKGALHFCIFVQKASGNFEIVLDGISLVLNGRILLSENTKTEFNKTVPVFYENSYDLTSNEVYNELENRGYQYQDHFRGILNAKFGDQGCISTIKWRNNWCSFIDSLIQVVLFIDGESSQDIYLPVDIQQVVIHPSLHAEPQDYEVVYQKVTGIIRGGGVEMLGLKTCHVDIFKNNEACVKLESFKFVSHSNPRLQMLERFLEVTLQIVSENIHSASKNKSAIVELEENYPFELISQHIKRTKDFPIFKDSVNTVSFKNVHKILSSNSNIGLIITPIDTLEKCGLVDSSSFILARSIGKQTPKISDGLVVVIEQQFDNEKLLLLKKAVSVEEKSPVVFLAGDEHIWPQQLKSELNISNGYNKRVYVVIKTKAPIDGKTLIQQLGKEPKADKLRYISILDENAPNFSLTEDIYLQQLQQDLVCNVYSEGSWGSFRQLPIDEMTEKPISLSLLPALRLKNIQINHVGLNLRDPTVNDSIQEKKLNDIGNLELSGTLVDGRRVMSIVQNTKDPIHNSLDPYLTWDIPESWSLEDAATVPWAYSTAYHGMIQAAKLSSGETVLIHAGHTPIGQAAIAFALHIGSTVFTTVTEIVHKEFLMKRFPRLKEKHILSLDNNIDISLMRETQGKGVNVLINCLCGSKLHSSLRCVSECGRFVQLGITDMEENTSIGMYIFLKHVAVLGIAVDNIFNASLAWKKELHSAIKEGIKLGIVQPLGNVLFTEHQTLEALSELSNYNNVKKVLIQLMGETRRTPENKKVLNTIKATNKSLFDLKNSHIIIGSEFEDCLCLAEWLVTHKANKITIASKSQKLSLHSERRMFLLRRYHNAHIIQTSAEKIHTLPGARSFIRNASSLGTVTTIFSIALNDATSLHNLDVASRSLDSLSHFVSLMDKSGEDVSKERFKAGLPILDVQWTDSQKSENIRPILKVMDRLLSSRSPPFINISLEDKLIKYTNEGSSFNEIGNFLPSSLEDLEGVGFDFLSKAKSPLVVIPSLSPGIGRVPEVPPIFIVPGIQDKTEKVLETLTNKILYPTICINLQDHNMSLSNSAGIIVKHMRNIQPVGPYNLVGVSWGGILALELARELQSQDQKIQLFLLDGAPDTTQSIAKLLGTGDELQCNLITRLLGIESNKVQEDLISLQDWKSRVAYVLHKMKNLSPKRKQYLENGLESSYLRINKLLSYKPPEKLLSGDVNLIRPEGALQEDHCELHKYFQGTVNIHLVDGDHRTLLSNRATADIINNEALANICV